MATLNDIQAQLASLGDKYGKLGFAVSLLNTILLVLLLLK